MTKGNGGVHAKRGTEFETQSLLNYLLIRMIEVKEQIKVTFESQQDATIVYPATAERSEIVELVQCKKRESPLPDADPLVIEGWDPWFLGSCRFADLKRWLESPTGGSPILQQLENPIYRYTVLLHGVCNNELERFVPGKLGPTAASYEPSSIIRVCPVPFEHAKNPDRKRVVGSEQIIRRVRVLPMPYPAILEAHSQNMVVLHGARPDAGYQVVQKLLRRVQKLQQAVDETNRRFSSEDAKQFIAAESYGRGDWQRSTNVLAHRSMLGGPGPEQPKDSEVISGGKIWKNDYFERAKAALFDQHAIVITGPVTSGKTTLCKYLMHEFGRAFPSSQAYYLDVHPADLLVDELAFFKQHLNLPALFVIENEHYSVDAVAELADAYRSENAKAYLVVTSTRTYSRTQASRSDHPLHELPSITIEDFGREDIHQLLGANLGGLESLTEEQQDFIANASEAIGGKIGFALIFARCFQGEPSRIPDDRVLDTDRAKRAVRTWLDQALMIPSDADFENRIVPILLIASYGIAISRGYDQDYIPKLCELRILGRASNESPDPEIVAALDMSFPLIVSRQYRHRTASIFSEYLQQNPHDLPVVSSTLVVDGMGKTVLRKLMNDPDLDLVAQLRDIFSRDAAGFAIALAAMRQAAPDLARRLFRNLAAPGGEIDKTIAKEIFESPGTRAIRTTINVLDVLNRLDRKLVRDIFGRAVGKPDMIESAWEIVRLLTTKLEAQSIGLAEAFSFILAIRRCHFSFGKALFDTFVSRRIYRQKMEALADSTRFVVDAIQCCRPLRSLSHKEFTVFVKEFLNEDKIATALVQRVGTLAALRLLRDLRRVHPRLAIRVVWKLWQTRPDWFQQMMIRSTDVIAAVGLLRAVAGIDRRIAIDFGVSHEEFLCQLAKQESDQFRLASAIQVTSSISPSLATAMAKQVNQKWLLERIQSEKHRIALAGRALSTYAQMWPPLTSVVLRDLDVTALYARVSWRSFLYNFVLLTRGILDAKRADIVENQGDPAADFILELCKDAQITDRVRAAMKCSEQDAQQTTDLREVTIAFSEMTEIGLTADNLFRLYGIANRTDMMHRIRCWMRQGNDFIGIRQFLYAMMLLSDQSYAREALSVLAPIIQHRQGLATRGHRFEQPRPIARTDKARFVPRGMELNDIAEIGDLLRLATVIDEDLAAELVHEFDLKRLAAFCANDGNLGRHAALLHGLHGASRLSCLKVVRQVYGDKVDDGALIDLLDENENIDNVLHLVRRLQIIAPSTAMRLIRLGIEHGQEKFLSLLGVEANLHNISRWLRILYGYPTIAPQHFQDEIVQILLDAQRYDERLFSHVEAALAVIDVNRKFEAYPFVTGIMSAANQAATLRSPMALIELILRLMRIDQGLNESCLEAILAYVKPAVLQRLLNTEDAVVVPGFLHYLFRQHIPSAQDRYAQVLDQAGAHLQKRIRQSAISPSVLVAEMLLDEAPDTFAGQLCNIETDDLRGFRPWEVGLIETIHDAIYQRIEAGLFVGHDLLRDLDTEHQHTILSRRRRYFSSDVTNIKCALSLRSSLDVKHLGLTDAAIQKIIKERRSCEPRNAVLLLLDQDFRSSELSKYPYYLKVLLDETVFAPYRFDWSSRIMAEIHSRIFVPA